MIVPTVAALVAAATARWLAEWAWLLVEHPIQAVASFATTEGVAALMESAEPVLRRAFPQERQNGGLRRW